MGNCDYNGTRVIYAASVPFIYVNYSGGFAFTDRVESSSGTADVRNIADGFDIRATYDLYGGSYLYEHIWRFYSDGQFGSTILVHGPGVDHNDHHTYHIPFRYDLDVSASGDAFQSRFLPFPFAPWANVAQEGRVLSFFPPTLFNWRLLDTATGKRAMIRAREGDNGEIWALPYSALEAWTSWGGAQSAPPGSPGQCARGLRQQPESGMPQPSWCRWSSWCLRRSAPQTGVRPHTARRPPAWIRAVLADRHPDTATPATQPEGLEPLSHRPWPQFKDDEQGGSPGVTQLATTD